MPDESQRREAPSLAWITATVSVVLAVVVVVDGAGELMSGAPDGHGDAMARGMMHAVFLVISIPCWVMAVFAYRAAESMLAAANLAGTLALLLSVLIDAVR